jgi:RNA polymerase sigma-70 factor (ECF subfamily)
MSDFGATRTSASLIERMRLAPDEPSSWRDFVDRYGPKIHRWCLRWNVQPADAEDITQTVLLKLAQRMRTFAYDPSRSFRAWLKTVTHHAWRDFVDARKPGQVGSGDTEMGKLLDDQQAPESLNASLDEEHQRAVLEEAMTRVQARVEPKTFEAFRLQVFEQKSGSDTARELGLSVTGVFMARSRVQAMLREEVERLDNPDRDAVL